MANNLRHFAWYRVNVEMTLHLAGYTLVKEHTVEFGCAFSLRWLRACIHPYRMFPKRFCSVKLDYEYVCDIATDSPLLESRLILHNYQQIEDAIIRGCLYTLSVDLMSLYYE